MAFNINDHPGKFCFRMVPIHSGVRNLEGMGISKVKVKGPVEREKKVDNWNRKCNYQAA